MTSRIDELFRWRDPVERVFTELKPFHEWVVQLAQDSFYSKKDHSPISMWVFQRHDGISVLETPWENPEEKSRVMHAIRGMVNADITKQFGVDIMATINEVWIASAEGKSAEELEAWRRQFGEVRFMPDREDGLMVQSYHRNGTSLVTRWVAKIKPDPQKSYLLARDDLDVSNLEQLGQHTNYFAPIRRPS